VVKWQITEEALCKTSKNRIRSDMKRTLDVSTPELTKLILHSPEAADGTTENLQNESGVLDLASSNPEHMHQLLQERLRDYCSSFLSGGYLSAIHSTCSFVLGSLRIEARIRRDNLALVLSSIIHNVNHGPHLLSKDRNNKNVRSGKISYSLMTKMMELNTTSTSRNLKGAQIGLYDGKFVFFFSMPIESLQPSNRAGFARMISDYLFKAMEVKKEMKFDNTTAAAVALTRPNLLPVVVDHARAG
jgi:hypothetical protein